MVKDPFAQAQGRSLGSGGEQGEAGQVVSEETEAVVFKVMVDEGKLSLGGGGFIKEEENETRLVQGQIANTCVRNLAELVVHWPDSFKVGIDLKEASAKDEAVRGSVDLVRV